MGNGRGAPSPGGLAVGPLVIWLPKPPDNANGRKHWAAAVAEKRAYWSELAIRQSTRYGIPNMPASPIRHATVTHEWFYPDQRHHIDPDNAVRRLKPAIDWLVAHGYLAGDTSRHLSWLPCVVHVGGDPLALCTVRLTLTPYVVLHGAPQSSADAPPSE